MKLNDEYWEKDKDYIIEKFMKVFDFIGVIFLLCCLNYYMRFDIVNYLCFGLMGILYFTMVGSYKKYINKKNVKENES